MAEHPPPLAPHNIHVPRHCLLPLPLHFEVPNTNATPTNNDHYETVFESQEGFMCTQFLDVYIQGPCKRSNKSIRSSRVLECVGARGAHIGKSGIYCGSVCARREVATTTICVGGKGGEGESEGGGEAYQKLQGRLALMSDAGKGIDANIRFPPRARPRG